MKVRDLSLPVINNWQSSRNYPFVALSPAFLRQWEAAAQGLDGASRNASTSVLRLLECFAQITGITLPEGLVKTNFAAWDQIFKQLLAGFYNPKFYIGEGSSRIRLSTALLKIRVRMAKNLGCQLTWIIPVYEKQQLSETLQRLATQFDELEIDVDLVRMWQGWVCPRKSFGYTLAQIYPIHLKLGPEFTQRLHEICIAYTSSREKSTLEPVNAFARFIATTSIEFDAQLLKNPEFTADFFYAFYEHYIKSRRSNGSRIRIIAAVSSWRGHITSFFFNFIFPSGLIAKPTGPFPTPSGMSLARDGTNIKKGLAGEEYHDKLLTIVPLHVDDDAAFNILFVKIKEDFEATKRWAWAEVEATSQALDRREELAKKGGVRRVDNKPVIEFSTRQGHPDRLANGAATFAHYGYPCRTHSFNNIGPHGISQLFEGPLSLWARDLALPVTGALIPHCAILVAEHPQITPSFLETFELYDKNGKLRGLSSTDGGEIATGVKRRRGPALAAQEIHLNAKTSFVIDQIIKITQPLRDLLKSENDDNWRYLLLNSGKGFAYPRRINSLASNCSSPAGLLRLSESSSRALGWERDKAEDFARRFSISALRATAGVVVYLETKSVQKMSEALGHAKYVPMLLDRYLPRVIQDFFQERWIRIFQTGIIVEAMQSSPHLLAASGLNSIDDLDSFLQHHSLIIPKDSSAPPSPNGDDVWAAGNIEPSKEVFFGLNTEILTILLSLAEVSKNPTRPMAAKAIYWADLTNALVPHIESAANQRDDIRSHLEAARLLASETLVSGIAYAQ